MISNSKTRVLDFPAALFAEIVETVKAAKDAGQPAIAAFDADGTLWDTDIGESFFDFEIRECGLPGLPPDPWARYRELKLINKPAAYAWLAQINAGQALRQVRDWASEAVERRVEGLPIFASQARLIERFQALDIEVYVVTASVKWAVEPAALKLGIPFDRVLGITTRVSADGIIGLEPVSPITWRAGKAEGLLQATGGRRPIFAAGNTYGDIALLQSATDARLAVATQDEANELHDEESKLWAFAQENGWMTHAFRALAANSR
jgi:phosphoserine phosphatase